MKSKLKPNKQPKVQETHVTKKWLVLVLYLIVLERATSFFDQL